MVKLGNKFVAIYVYSLCGGINVNYGNYVLVKSNHLRPLNYPYIKANQY